MPSTPTRLGALAGAAVLGAAVLGCGLVRQVNQTVNNLSAVSDLADKLDGARNLTYTAEYQVTNGAKTTVVQQPPKAAYRSDSGSIIVTEDSLLYCTTASGQAECQRQPNGGNVSSGEDTALMSAIAGDGFVSSTMAFTFATAASIIPGVKVARSTRKIAGLSSTCLKITGIPQDPNGQQTGLHDFTACVADTGLLTSFSGTTTDGRAAGVELQKYRDSADPQAFEPPAGAKIVDVTTIADPSPTG